MQPFQQRVVDEAKDLHDRLSRLNEFLKTEIFDNLPLDEKNLLVKQSEVMEEYHDILTDRINLFTF